MEEPERVVVTAWVGVGLATSLDEVVPSTVEVEERALEVVVMTELMVSDPVLLKANTALLTGSNQHSASFALPLSVICTHQQNP